MDVKYHDRKMSSETSFDVAFGRCVVRDGELVVERSDPDQLGRVRVFREGLAMNAEHRPWATRAWVGGVLLLALVFAVLLVDIYTANPDAWPLVVVLAVGGVSALGLPLEVSYRRAARERQRLRGTVADEFTLVDRRRVPLEEVTAVTARPVSTGFLVGDGHLLLVHLGENAVIYLGFPAAMADELGAARTVFKRRGIEVVDETDEDGA